ncbi:alpha/beta hydrolase family protein [Streptomyces sp. NPDC004609]|uniref:alpha/beta hydrolase family protein n=1 Tax=Streptomyces sp. NPDC004609 TaxID=3364704 RepID=UPI00368AFDE3
MIRPTRAATAAVLALVLALPATAAGTASAAGVRDAAGDRSAAAVRETAGAPAAPDTAVRTPQRSASAPAPSPSQPLRLPRPTGKYAVGSTVLPLADRSRTDPWVPAAGARELMVTVHYPAARSASGRPAPYATTDETRLLVKGLGIDALVPAEVLSATRTHSRVGARPAKGRYPLVVLSPGFSVSRYTLTGLAEDLASRGHVVASVDHAYESFGISVPGGRTLTCVACTALDEQGVPASVVTTTRAADVSFVLDRLTGSRPVWRHAAMIDKRRIGMAGHSIGGASAATAMAGDPRVGAGVNMDGAFWEELPAGGLGGRPFMMLGTDDEVHRPGGTDRTWDTMWPALDGWKRWLTVAGTEHGSFSDSPLISEHFGLPQAPLSARRTLSITRDYVAAFFDRNLKGVPQPLLEGPSAAHPEVKFHNP